MIQVDTIDRVLRAVGVVRSAFACLGLYLYQ